MKPILILPPDQMSKEDMDRLRENDICVVEAKDPSLVRFCEPPPTRNLDEVTLASINLSRYVALNPHIPFQGKDLSAYWAKALTDAYPLSKAAVPKAPEVPKNKPKR